MLPLESPFRVGEPAYFYFWQFPVTKKYHLPKYYIGQIVLLQIKHHDGEILAPVEVVGLWHGDAEWTYMIKLMPGHPEFKEEVSDVWDAKDWELEPM